MLLTRQELDDQRDPEPHCKRRLEMPWDRRALAHQLAENARQRGDQHCGDDEATHALAKETCWAHAGLNVRYFHYPERNCAAQRNFAVARASYDNLLLIDDDVELCSMLTEYLGKNGFHVKAVHRGARLFVVDPRRTSSAEWADRWLGLDVGTDIALALAVGREIIHAGLANTTFIERGTEGYEQFADCVEPWTLEAAAEETGVPADAFNPFNPFEQIISGGTRARLRARGGSDDA